MKNSVEIDGRVYPLPLIGQRCPRCHRPAPRLDGIPCKLCSPTCGTLTDPKTGITHAAKGGCIEEIDLVGMRLKHYNVGPVTVTCMECIAATIEDGPRFIPWDKTLVEYSKADTEMTIKHYQLQHLDKSP